MNGWEFQLARYGSLLGFGSWDIGSPAVPRCAGLCCAEVSSMARRVGMPLVPHVDYQWLPGGLVCFLGETQRVKTRNTGGQHSSKVTSPVSFLVIHHLAVWLGSSGSEMLSTHRYFRSAKLELRWRHIACFCTSLIASMEDANWALKSAMSSSISLPLQSSGLPEIRGGYQREIARVSSSEVSIVRWRNLAPQGFKPELIAVAGETRLLESQGEGGPNLNCWGLVV